MKKNFFFILCFFACMTVFAQKQKVVPFNGVVEDVLGQPLRGARVWVVNPDYYATTDRKGKFGLNEMDIEGLQALTAGKNVLISSVKEQVAIQAKKAELKIKQQTAAASGGGISGRGGDGGLSSSSPYSTGREFMDNIFGMQIPDPVSTNIPATVGTEATPESAASFLDGLTVGDAVNNEAAGYTLKVLIDGDDDSSARFAMVDSDNNEVDLPGQSLPDSTNITVNRDIDKAYGDGMVPYDIIRRY